MNFNQSENKKMSKKNKNDQTSYDVIAATLGFPL